MLREPLCNLPGRRAIQEPEAQDTGTGIQMRGVEKMEERNCLTCRHVDLSIRQSPCKECVSEGRRYRYWEPDETEDEEKKEEKGKEDKDWKWPCFEKLLESVGEMGKNIEKGAKEIKLKKREFVKMLKVWNTLLLC